MAYHAIQRFGSGTLNGQVEAMDGTSRQRLRVWEDATMTILQDHADSRPAGPHNPSAFAERLYASETLDSAQTPPADEAAEPYTLQWFLDIENQRHGRQGRWIPRLMEFSKHAGDTLLGLGNGLGTDWLQYARHGAQVVVCSPSGAQLSLIRRNFELRGLAGRFLHAAPISLPLETASVDVACISSLLHEVPDPQAIIHEVYRVLKPGGKVLAVTPAHYDVDYWNQLLFPWRQRRQRPDAAAPLRFTSRSLKRLFASFAEHRIYKRHLRRSEVPHLWRWLPTQVLERLLGHVLIVKAFKPLSAAISLAQAA